ncbi:hypothetical protein AB0N99_31080 [Streptomyces sp. NPDC093272]|uniref:hypothetical protein n=1 Tax=Streptomyces sp. NPDC093272 TaxID=3154981 RepID=UPI00341E4D46
MGKTKKGASVSERQAPSRGLLAVIGILGLALPCLAIGFYAGRATAPAADAGCADAHTSLNQMLQQQKAMPANSSQDDKAQWAVAASNLVLQNPDCFDVGMRAAAQTAKDRVASNQNSAAVSGAADRIADCLGKINVGFSC